MFKDALLYIQSISQRDMSLKVSVGRQGKSKHDLILKYIVGVNDQSMSNTINKYSNGNIAAQMASRQL